LKQLELLSNKENLPPILGGLFLGLAWIFPYSAASVVLGWLSVACFVHAALVPSVNLKFIYFGGALSHVIAFWWLNETVAKFGGFGIIPTSLIFCLFVGISSLQFPGFAFVVRRVDPDLKKYCLTTPVIWCALEFFVFRLFPWGYGHTQIGFLPLVQIADIGGVLLISFLMFWLAEAGVRYLISIHIGRNHRP